MNPEADISLRKPIAGAESAVPSLVQQAGGLDRATIMRDVAGPHMERFLRPIYDPKLTEAEQERLFSGFAPSELKDNFFVFYSFFHSTMKVLSTRLANISIGSNPQYEQIDTLNRSRGDLFHYNEYTKMMLEEGVKSGITVPLTVAAQIYTLEEQLERGESLDDLDDASFHGMMPEKIIEIMERESFDEILMHLTKGPNGFLGSQTGEFYPSVWFFEFLDSEAQEQGRDSRLSIINAYEIQNGKVVGLSEAYHISANDRRRFIKKNYDIDEHKITDSSGCPVRHSFPDPETGEPQESLVITAKKFLVAALETGQKQEAA